MIIPTALVRLILCVSVTSVCVFLCSACHDPLIQPARRFSRDIVYYTAEGGVVIWNGDKQCVAPPAQAARMTDVNANGDVGVQSGSSINIGATGSYVSDREVAQLYKQGQGNLFLQFALYRLCEMSLNGILSEDEYVDLYKEVLNLATELVKAEQGLEESRAKRLKEEQKALLKRTLVN